MVVGIRRVANCSASKAPLCRRSVEIRCIPKTTRLQASSRFRDVARAWKVISYIETHSTLEAKGPKFSFSAAGCKWDEAGIGVGVGCEREPWK